MYAIYAPIIQDEFADFITLWNRHKIRTQKNRQHVVSGSPIDLYNTQDIRNWGVPLGEEEDSNDRIALRTMLNPLQDIEIDTFLPAETTDWCTRELSEMGFFQQEIESFDRPFLLAYTTLQQCIQEHQQTGQLPILGLTPIPTGGAHQYIRKSVITRTIGY